MSFGHRISNMPYENKATAKHNWYLLPQPTLKTFYPIAALILSRALHSCTNLL